MPLWLDLLCTPMAAPETPKLRRMRRTWQVLCLALALAVAGLRPFTAAIGRLAPCLIGALLAATIGYSAAYLLRKHRADKAYLAQLGERE